ncbi:MAG: hypothetical protein IJU76_12865 [Desulfovibrionaceae bacterium]|nr:hypothetical protein [Desulfovibrionaceae bacterium]
MKKCILPALLVLGLCLCACAKNVEPEPEQTPKELDVASLKAAQDTDQLVVLDVVGENDATLRLYEKKESDGGLVWSEVLKTDAKFGRNGLGKTMEGDEKTPSGVYTFTEAFGIADNPGTAFKYTKLNKNHYWDTNPKSRTYNTLVSVKKGKRSKVKGEHLIEGTEAYQYALVINYNPERRPEVGSAIFLRCTTGEPSTAGSVTVDADALKTLLMQLKPTAKILIAMHDELASY